MTARVSRTLVALLGTALAGAVLVLGGLAGTGIASAHSAIVKMDPPDGAQLDHGPDAVTVTFNEAISKNFAKLTVVGPDGNLWSHGDPAVDGPDVSVPVGELGPAGTYTVAVKVISADGHKVAYTRSFELTQAGDGTPGPKAGQADSGSDSGSDSDSDAAATADSDSWITQIWWFVAAAVVLFGGGLWYAMRKPGDDD